MRIENLRSENRGDLSRVCATIIWEDCDRPTQEVFFETVQEFAQALSCNPHAFLVGCIMPAMRHNEQRILINAELCPELKDGLTTVMSWIRHWYGQDHEPVQIEAQVASTAPVVRMARRTALFFSGGIDSLAGLRANRLHIPIEHHSYIKDCLLLYGINWESDNRLETFEQAAASLSVVAKDADTTLIPIYTNIRSLDDDTQFFQRQFHGAILSAAAHALTNRLHTVLISSTVDLPNVEQIPWGSHPFLDPNYSSYDLEVHHDRLELSRLQKTKLIADWDIGLQNIKVCNPNWPGMNCGECEKCIRTMLALLVLGKLDQTSAFPHFLSEELVASAVRLSTLTVCYYKELVEPLKEMRYRSLARVIERKILKFYHHDPFWRAAKKRLKRFDQEYLNGHLTSFKRVLRPIPSTRSSV
jgi:hypothetical protein